MKCTLLVTRRCNLRCDYCYVGKSKASMSIPRARQIVDKIFELTPENEKIDIAFFGGEPLIEFAKIQAITDIIESHPLYDPDRISITLVSNGTLFNPKIAAYIRKHGVAFGISCDGPPEIHDRFRHFPSGKGSSARVERTIRHAVEEFDGVMVNAVYGPETFENLAQTVSYFSQLGVRQIYLSPDFSAAWTPEQAQKLESVYGEVGNLYIDYYLHGDAHFISLVDSKIAVILRGGYQPQEKCRMGRGELAFTPDGRVYPCERLVGAGDDHESHCLGSVQHGIELKRMDAHRAAQSNNTCTDCSLKNYCMNWCGCSNYFATGNYNKVAPILCSSEQAAIRNAARIYQQLSRKMQNVFYEHASGSPLLNSISCRAQ